MNGGDPLLGDSSSTRPAVTDPGADPVVGDATPAAPADRDAKIEAAKRLAEQRDTGNGSGSDTSSDDPSLGLLRQRTRSWWHRHLDSEERQRIMGELAIKKQEHWGFRFSTMLTLSVIVAVMGLSADSAAVVIGAMLLAPLMQPVLATAACLSMALFKKTLRSLAIVGLATAGSIALSYVLAALFVRGELPNEVTSRVAPDIRDLVVALGAGTAGAYATVRKDASSSLPGVAVAVALVPPLGAVGIALEAGNATFARGAMLLYTTNLAAIVLAGAIVFVATGFVPPRRLANTFRRSSVAAAAVAVIVVAIAVPLYRASTTAVEASEREIEAREIVADWLGLVDVRSEPSISFDDDNSRITVGIRSFETALDSQSLSDDLQARFGADQVVSVEWDRVERAVTTTTAAPTTTIVSDEERLLNDVESIVDQWLEQERPGSGRRDALLIRDGEVFLDASGVGGPPALESLTLLLDEELDATLRVTLTWVERQNVDVEAPPTPDEELANTINVLSRAWADVEGVTILSTSFDGERAIIEVTGPETPDATSLVTAIEDILDPTDDVTVLFTERLDITTTTTTTTTTTSTVPTTTTTSP